MAQSSLYGCHSHPRSDGYYAMNRTYIDGKPQHGWKWIANTMSRECRYDQQATDAKCIGCTKSKA